MDNWSYIKWCVTTALTAAVVLGMLLGVWARPADAAPCTDRDAALQRLADEYGEVRTGFGVNPTGSLVELFETAPGAGEPTWTITVTTPAGVTCLLAAGEGWRAVEHVEPGEKL